MLKDIISNVNNIVDSDKEESTTNQIEVLAIIPQEKEVISVIEIQIPIILATQESMPIESTREE